MERVTFKNSRNLTLVGNLYPAVSDKIIIMCHGFCSDKNSRGRFPRLAKKFNEIGYNAFSFDFSGCGESDNDSLTMAKEVDDLKSAIAFIKSKGFNKIALYGHSLGTVICLKCYSPEIITMALSGAGTDSMKYDWNDFYSKEQIKELEENGYLTEKVDGVRKEIIVDQQMLKDFELVRQEELLSGITCPILIIHGDNDEEERLLCGNSKRGMRLLSSDSRLFIINGANHSFMDHLDKLVDLVSNWMKRFLG